MSTCDVSAGRAIPCKQGSAGIKAVYFLNRPFVVTMDGADTSQVGDIQTEASGAVTVYKYEVDNTGSNFTENLQAERDNGTKGYEQVLTLVLQSLQEQDVVQIDNLAAGKPAAIVHYRNGKSRLVGEQQGIDTSGNNASGGAINDFQGLNLTCTALEDSYAPYLNGSTKTNPFAGLDTAPTVVEADS